MTHIGETRAQSRFFYGWRVVFAAVTANFASAVQFNSSYGVFMAVMGPDLGWSRTAMSGVQAIGRLPELVLGPFLGPFVDRHGARWLIGIGGLLVGGAFIAMSATQEIWQLYLFRGFVTSAGAVCLGSFLGVTVSNWFVRRRARALSMLAMGSSGANATMPIVTAAVVQALGWRTSWTVMGLMTIALAIPALMYFRRRPEDVGLRPDGEPVDQALDAHPGQPLTAKQIASDRVWTRREVLATPTFWIMSFAFGVAALALTATNLHLVPYLQDLGYSLPIAAGAVSLRATVGFLGSPAWGLGIERMPFRVSLILPFLCQALSMLVLLFFPTSEGLVLALVLYGLGYAGVSILTELAWAHYFGRVSLGTVRGSPLPSRPSWPRRDPSPWVSSSTCFIAIVMRGSCLRAASPYPQCCSNSLVHPRREKWR